MILPRRNEIFLNGNTKFSRQQPSHRNGNSTILMILLSNLYKSKETTWLHKKNREQPIHLAMLIVLLLPKTISWKGNLIASSHLVDYVKKGGKLKNWGSLKFPSLCIWARAPPKTSISFSSFLQPCKIRSFKRQIPPQKPNLDNDMKQIIIMNALLLPIRFDIRRGSWNYYPSNIEEKEALRAK